MTPGFSVADPATWPVTLTADQIAAIYHRSVAGVRHACADKTFVPAPFLARPRYLWKRSDVLRHLGLSDTPGLRRIG